MTLTADLGFGTAAITRLPGAFAHGGHLLTAHRSQVSAFERPGERWAQPICLDECTCDGNRGFSHTWASLVPHRGAVKGYFHILWVRYSLNEFAVNKLARSIGPKWSQPEILHVCLTLSQNGTEKWTGWTPGNKWCLSGFMHNNCLGCKWAHPSAVKPLCSCKVLHAGTSAQPGSCCFSRPQAPGNKPEPSRPGTLSSEKIPKTWRKLW